MSRRPEARRACCDGRRVWRGVWPCFAAAVIGSAVVALALAASVRAQTPAERVSFEAAIKRAIEKNPSSAIAAAGILRAVALLTEARADTRLQINGNISTTTLNRGVAFQDETVVPRNSAIAALDVRMPLFAPARWARRAQAEDAKSVAELSAETVRRQTALAAADAYLTIVARRRVVAANERARDVARAHFDLAHELQQRGTGSRLNELRAQQEQSVDETLVEAVHLALYRAQEALGVLLAADGPVDASDEPSFDVAAAPTTDLIQLRPDLKFLFARQEAAARELRDSAKDYWPLLEGVFQPQSTHPSRFFTPANSWRFLLQFSVPL